MSIALSTVMRSHGSSADDLQILYTPYVNVVTDAGQSSFNRWESTLGFFNNSDTPATFVQVAVYGKTPVEIPPDTTCGKTVTVPPHTGTGIGMGICGPGDGSFGFLVFKTSPSMIAWSDVTRVRYICDSYRECVGWPLGGTPTPAYRALFPAGRTAVTGAVELGLLDVPAADPSRQYKRRVNVTLFNGGDTTGTFVVSMIPANISSAPVSQQTVTVPAKSVIQINSFPLPTGDFGNLAYLYGCYRGWIAVKADQPFLSYVSAIFDNPEPGALPFEVYPSYLQN